MPLPLAHLVRHWLPTPDPRSDEELSHDLEDEFAFHLDHLAREYEAEGHDAATARRLAGERFGCVESIRLACVRIARKEEHMLQKTNLVLMIVVLLMLGAVSVQMWRAQTTQTQAIRSLGEQIAALQVDSSAAPTSQEPPRQIYITGAAQRSGTYDLPVNGRLTLLQLLSLVGVPPIQRGNDDIRITLTSGTGEAARTHIYRFTELKADPATIPFLEPGDVVEISMIPTSPSGSSESASLAGSAGTSRPPFRVPEQLQGTWECVGDQAQPEATRWVLTIKGTDDITNLSGSPEGSLRAPGVDHPIRLRFKTALTQAASSNVEILDSFEQVGYLQHGRAILSSDGQTLMLNLSTAPGAPPGAARLVFTRVSTGETEAPHG